MKENKISIEIDKPIQEVFEFTTNPKNTPLWIDSIVSEQSDQWPIKIDTKYKNVGREGTWTEYLVVQIIVNKLFELKQVNGSYHVRYTYEKISDKRTKLTYFEWVDNGELESPFSIDVLEKLKKVMEGSGARTMRKAVE